ncbi:MAG: DUF2974 domain-containing protein, partial [Firmicutes bacterium]|nr:DUF2974 domain-containing protein [Bacillota bacterium]
EYSVIGRLMEPQLSDTRIVQSAFDGFMQHSLASWGVYHGGLALSDMTEPKDRWINETLRTWIEGMPYETRRTFVNELFDALMSGGAQTVPELTSNGLAGMEAVLKSFTGFSDSTKEVLSQLKNAAIAELKDSTLSGLAGLKDTALSGIKEAAKDGATAAIGGASAAIEGAKKAISSILNIEKNLDEAIGAAEDKE